MLSICIHRIGLQELHLEKKQSGEAQKEMEEYSKKKE